MCARFTLLALISLLLTACGDHDANDVETDAAAGTLITTHIVEVETIEILQRTLGRIASRTAPSVAAEISGRIMAIHQDTGDQVNRGDLLLDIDPEPYALALEAAQAEVRQLDATIANQEQELARNRELVEEDFVTQSEVDAAEAELAALRQQLEFARVQVESAQRDLRNTRIISPVNGEIDQRMVSSGDFISPGDPLLRVVSQDSLRITLPFPETIGASLERGQAVRLRAPLTDNGQLESTITELRPALMGTSRTIEVIVNIDNPGGWREGGSVNADVVIATRDNVVVPNLSLVQRPAGEVVYVIEDDTAHAREVEVGARRDENTEILAGLDAGAVIAADGAGFLSDGATVRISEQAEE